MIIWGYRILAFSDGFHYLYLMLTLIATVSAEVTYQGFTSNHRWGDVQCPNPSFLAKIKNQKQLENAQKTGPIMHQNPQEYWIGLRYNAQKNAFYWSDGSAVSWNADIASIVKVESSATDLCYYLTETGAWLLSTDCTNAHKKYICQTGETKEELPQSSSAMTVALPGITSATSPYLTTLSPFQLESSTPIQTALYSHTKSSPQSKPTSASVPSSSSTTTTTTTTTTTKIQATLPSAHRPTYSSVPMSSSTTKVAATLSPAHRPAFSSVPMSSSWVPAPYLRTLIASKSVGNVTSREKSNDGHSNPVTTSVRDVKITPKSPPKLVNKFSRVLRSLNASKKSSLQEAVSHASSLLGDLRESGDQDGRVMMAGKELEAFGIKYAKHHNQSTTITNKEFELSVRSVTANVKEDVVFSATRGQSQSNQETEQVRIPARLFKGQKRIVVFILYKNTTRLMRRVSRLLDGKFVASGGVQTSIVSCALEPPITGKLAENATIVLHAQENLDRGSEICVFWDFSAHSPYNGSWSGRGCSVKERTHEIIKCTCNHFTNFAVFMQVDGVKISSQHENALAIITYIGCGLSLVGETLTMVIYGLLMDFKTETAHIRFNLAMSIAIAQVLFLSGVEATSNQGFCIAVAALIHYFYLVGFHWMLMEGLVLYFKVVQVFNIRLKLSLFYITSWGMPAVVVGMSLIMASSFEEGIKSYIQDQLCWLSFSSDLIWAFVVPVIIVILINSIVLISVVRQIAKLESLTEGLHIRQSLKACFTLFPLLGLTWIFGLLSVTPGALGLVFQYIFTILNSLQGFLVFILHVVKSKEVKATIQRKKEVWDTKRSVVHHSVNGHMTDVSRVRQTDVFFHNPTSVSVPSSRHCARNNQVTPSAVELQPTVG